MYYHLDPLKYHLKLTHPQIEDGGEDSSIVPAFEEVANHVQTEEGRGEGSDVFTSDDTLTL